MSNHSFSATGTYFVYASCDNVSEPQQECIFALLEEWSHPFYCLPTSLSHVCTISIKDYRNILIGDLAFVEDNENAGFPTGHQVRLRQSIVFLRSIERLRCEISSPSSSDRLFGIWNTSYWGLQYTLIIHCLCLVPF